MSFGLKLFGRATFSQILLLTAEFKCDKDPVLGEYVLYVQAVMLYLTRTALSGECVCINLVI